MSDKHVSLHFGLAIRAALESKYDGTKVGAVIVKDGRIVSTGWNGYPSGSDDKSNNSMERSKRLLLAIHAEENAILNAARTGNSAQDSIVYVTHKPCVACMARLSNAGVKEVRFIKNSGYEAAWCDELNDVYDAIPLSSRSVSYSVDSTMIPSDKTIYKTLDRYQIEEHKEAHDPEKRFLL